MLLGTGLSLATFPERNADCVKWPSAVFKVVLTISKKFSMATMSGRINRLYDFEKFRLYPQKRLLTRENQPVPLTPKAIETLIVLVENRNRVVAKDELMKTLWPDSFVEEANLSQNIF